MAWTTPATFTVGEVVTASKLNTHVRDNMRYLKGLDGVTAFDNGITVNGSAIVASVIRSGGSGAALTFEDRTNALNLWSWFSTGGYAHMYDGSSFRMSVSQANGYVGLGTQAPNNLLHMARSPGGAIFFFASAIAGTPHTILSNSLMSQRYSVWGTVHRVTAGAGQAVNAAGNTASGTADIYTDGGSNVLRMTGASGGLTVARAAGSDTYNVCLLVTYL